MKKNSLHPRTEIINTKQRQKCRIARQTALTWLSRRFPKAFDTELSIQPLKLGIMNDILMYADEALSQGISKSKLRQAVVVFTRRIDYLACLKAQDFRIDLDGNLNEQVTEDDAIRAAQKIKKIVEKSIKNQRKQNFEYSPVRNFNVQQMDTRPNYHFEREAPAPKKIEVVIKSKPGKNIDPAAVERLKSKLGLGKKLEQPESETMV